MKIRFIFIAILLGFYLNINAQNKMILNVEQGEHQIVTM